jgi:membrane-bound lytic murein transglycosylase B
VFKIATALLAAAVLAACAQEADPVASPARPKLVTTTTEAPTTSTTAATTTTAPPTATTAPAAPDVDVFALVPPAPARTTRGLADQITTAEQTIRDPASTELELARAGLAQQVAYRQLGAHPEWDARVAALLPAELRRVAELHAGARREFRGMHSRLSSTLPAWRIVRPEPSDELLDAYKDAEAEFGIPWKYLAAINLVETGIGRIRGTSSAGAQGPMQFMPPTWAAYGGGGDINDVHDSIRAAARYLAANNGANDIANALWHYNHSHRYVVGVRIYADLIAEHPQAFLGIYHWGIWYLTDRGEVYLPVGYAESAPVPVAEYRAGQ